MGSPVIWFIVLFNAGYVPALSVWVSAMQQEKVKQLIRKYGRKQQKKATEIGEQV